VLSHEDDDEEEQDDDNCNTSIRLHSREQSVNRYTSHSLLGASPSVNTTSTRTSMTTVSSAQLAEENHYLNDELNRVETILNLTRAEKDELSIRYNALSDRVRFVLLRFSCSKKT
jgi:phosphatidate phosphatase PAH1